MSVTVVALLVAAIAQATTGFGYALIAVPLLTLVADPRTAVATVTITGLGVAATTSIHDLACVHWRTAGSLIGAAIAGMPLGLLLSSHLTDSVVESAIAVCGGACTVIVWRGVRLHTGGPVALASLGLLAGVLSTATGTNGPPLVAALRATGKDPRSFRATLAAVFAGVGLASTVLFAVSGYITIEVERLAVVGLPGVQIGCWIGNRLFTRIRPAVFRNLVLLGMCSVSAVTAVHVLI